MLMLLVGIILFFGIHSVSVFALPLRDRLAARNELSWKAGYSVVSLAGLILIVIGYGQARLEPTVLYSPPSLLYTIVPVLLLPTFILLVAPYFPGRISARANHPQLIAIKLWAVCHLLVNGNLADVLLFGSFLAWAVVVRISLKRRPQRKVPGAPPSRANDIIAVVLGLGIYALFVFWLHQKWFGMDPLVGI